tara:strand:- start:575 stop:784 length:210 start_codon:yes stop_codon:yes gene_type:complete
MPTIDFVFGDSSKTVDLKDVNSVDDVASNMKEVIAEETTKTNEMDLDPSTGQPNWFKNGNLSKYYETNN